MREMRTKNIVPDAAAYTTLINAYFKGKNLSKCWEIWNGIESKKNKMSN